MNYPVTSNATFYLSITLLLVSSFYFYKKKSIFDGPKKHYMILSAVFVLLTLILTSLMKFKFEPVELDEKVHKKTELVANAAKARNYLYSFITSIFTSAIALIFLMLIYLE